MSDILFQFLQQYIPVPDALRLRLTAVTQVKRFDKLQYLHQPGRVCEHTYFVVDGLLRVYYQQDEKDITTDFAVPGEWMTAVFSFLRAVPDHFHVQALAPTEVIVLSMADLQQCFIDFPVMERYGRMLMSQYYVQQSERMMALQVLPARERYHWFATSYPQLLQQVPLGMIASYLGITQETLSRIRAR